MTEQNGLERSSATEELRRLLDELQDENARLRSCLSYDEEEARLIISEYNELREKYAEVCETSAMLRADMAAARERQAKLRAANKAQADRLAVENAKLRELVRSFHSGMLFMLETGMWATDPKWLEERMEKLGIEVRA